MKWTLREQFNIFSVCLMIAFSLSFYKLWSSSFYDLNHCTLYLFCVGWQLRMIENEIIIYFVYPQLCICFMKISSIENVLKLRQQFYSLNIGWIYCFFFIFRKKYGVQKNGIENKVSLRVDSTTLFVLFNCSFDEKKLLLLVFIWFCQNSVVNAKISSSLTLVYCIVYQIYSKEEEVRKKNAEHEHTNVKARQKWL